MKICPYFNFYQKGALIGLCLDIRLRQLSGGTMGTQELMQALIKKYGKDAAFEDDELFDVITQMTFPEIRSFFKDCVEGGKNLPLKDLLKQAGFDFNETQQTVRVLQYPNEQQLALRKAWISQ